MRLVARNALSKEVHRVSADSRRSDERTRAKGARVYAVFSPDEPEQFLGLVGAGAIHSAEGRIFWDLLPKRCVEPVLPDTPLDDILRQMERDAVEVVPVVDEAGSYQGVVTLEELLKRHLESERRLLAEARRLREEADRERVRIERWAARVDELNQAFGELFQLIAEMGMEEEILQRGSEALAQILDARYCGVLMRDGGDHVPQFIQCGVTLEEAERIGTAPQGRGLLGIPLEQGISLRISDLSRDPRSCGFPEGHPRMRSLLAVPIASGSDVFGNLYLAEKRSGEPFTEDDEVVARGFASVLALATDAARQQAQRGRAERKLVEAQKLESVGRLAAGVAHEINTPAQYVGDNLRFLDESFGEVAERMQVLGELVTAAEAGEIPSAVLERARQKISGEDAELLLEEVPAAIRDSIEGVDRVTTIVRAMKEFAHPGTKEKTHADLNKIIQGTVTVARNEWKYVADVETELDAALPLVLCLPGEIGQVILNLVINAAHAVADRWGESGDRKGRITIRTLREEGRIRVEVQDDGTGIPEELRGRVFDPFFTTNQGGREGYGAGSLHRPLGHRGEARWVSGRRVGGRTGYDVHSAPSPGIRRFFGRAGRLIALEPACRRRGVSRCSSRVGAA